MQETVKEFGANVTFGPNEPLLTSGICGVDAARAGEIAGVRGINIEVKRAGGDAGGAMPEAVLDGEDVHEFGRQGLSGEQAERGLESGENVAGIWRVSVDGEERISRKVGWLLCG